jgi:hypothetical protein
MEIVAYTLLLVGFVVALVYGIQLLVLAFRTSILWGLGYLLVPFVALVFIVMHWDEAREPFLKGLIAIPLYIVGLMLLPDASAL